MLSSDYDVVTEITNTQQQQQPVQTHDISKGLTGKKRVIRSGWGFVGGRESPE